MPRTARIKGEFSTYHIIMRGNERKNIFITETDKLRFIEILKRMKQKYNFKLEAYCLMDNHVHLLLDDNGNDISKILKSINISYVYYFNHSYQRTGHLFQDRFKSELVDRDSYLLAVSVYIHNNPVKAGMVPTPEEYIWSSCAFYTGSREDKAKLVDDGRVLSLFSTQRRKARSAYRECLFKDETDSEILDVEEDRLRYLKDNPEYIDSYATALQLVMQELETLGMTAEQLKDEKELRCKLIQRLRRNSNLSLKEIGQLCGGVSPSMICKLLKG